MMPSARSIATIFVIVGIAVAVASAVMLARRGPPAALRTPAISARAKHDLDRSIDRSIRFLESHPPHPYEMAFTEFLRRRFALDAFAGMPERFDQATPGSRAPWPAELRVFRRLLHPEHELDPADLEELSVDTDRALAAALYCDRRPVPQGYDKILRLLADWGRYRLTHVGIAVIALRDNGCEVPGGLPFVDEMTTSLAELVRAERVTDLALEAAAVLLYLDRGELLPPDYVDEVMRAQQENGAWIDPKEPSPWHTTVVGLWTLLESRPGERFDRFVPQNRNQASVR